MKVLFRNSFFSKNFSNGFLIALLIVLSGCGFWTNFKTYFNTYYNANKIFQESEEKILEEREELFAFEEKPISSNLSKNFDEVIEKTSAIMQHNKESDYVEEAILMTGKSFYYQNNYSRALRKFNELASIPNSELSLENELWTAKTFLQMREFNKGLKLINEAIKKAKESEAAEILTEAYKSKIGYLIYAKEYDSVIDEINNFLETDIDDELRAAVLYELGLMQKFNEEYELAEESFVEVQEYSPTFEIDFKSKFELAKIKGELQQTDESMELLQSLRDEDKFSDNWDDIDLEIGKILYDKKEMIKALDKFTEVDTTYKNTESAGISSFYRAEILENFINDYDSALVIYKKAASSQAPEELRLLAQRKTGLLNKYITFHDKLKELKTQLLYLTDENAFRSDSLDFIEKVKADSIKQANENPQTKSKLKNRQNISKYKAPERPTISVDSVHALNSKYDFELANLLFTEFDNPDSAFYYYQLSLQEKEQNPNQAQTLYAIGSYYLIKNEKEKADSLFTLVYNKFQYDPIRNEAAKHIGKPLYDFDKDPVEDEYKVAEEIYSGTKYNDAISKLFEIYENNPKSIYASKSLYTIGYILENDLNMLDSAASIYDTLNTKYRSSEYAKAVVNKLNGFKQERQRLKAVQDSIKKANEVTEEIIDSVKVNGIPKTEDQKKINEDKIEGVQDSSVTVMPQKKVTLNESDLIEDSDTTQVVSRDIYKSEDQYYVQVSSWKTRETAENEIKNLKTKNYNAIIVEAFVEELKDIYYRVRIGPYKSFNSAKSVRQKLNKY